MTAALLWHAFGWYPPKPAIATPLVRGTGGGVTIAGELWRVSKNGTRLEEITDVLVSCAVDWDAGREPGTLMGAKITLSDPGRLAPFRDFVMPFLVLTFDDGSPRIRQKCGLFLVDQPDERHTRETGEATYPCRDLTAYLADSVYSDTLAIASGTTVASAIDTILGPTGIVRYAFAVGSRTLSKARTYPPGTTRLEALNGLLRGVGFWPVYCDHDGYLTSQKMRQRTQQAPFARYTKDDPVDVVQVTPARQKVANVVVVKKDRTDDSPLVAIRRNTDPTSPSSTVALGREVLYGGKPVSDPDLETQADVDAYADDLLERVKSYEQTVKLKVLPRTAEEVPPGLHATVWLQSFSTKYARLNGRYWLRSWRLGFTPEEAAVELTLNRLTQDVEPGGSA